MNESTQGGINMNYLSRWYISRTIRQTLNGRNRQLKQHEKGRFTATDADAIVKRTWIHYDRLLPNSPKMKTSGNRVLMNNGVVSLALYRAICEKTEDRDYVTQLAGDVLWKIYKSSMKLPVTLARLIHRDRKKQMNFLCRMATKYRYAPPAYEVKNRFENGTFYMDFYRCPIFDYFREQGIEELAFFRKTWCTFDWPVIEELVSGPVRYERKQTLSAEDGVCDMRWIVLEE